MHELGHIRRAWDSIQDGSFRLPYSAVDAAARAEEEILSDLDKAPVRCDLPVPARKPYVKYLRRGLISQLTNQPVDIRIEMSIFQLFPEHQQSQRKYLLSEEVLSAKIASPEFRQHLPPRLTERNMAMNLAYSKAISGIVRQPSLWWSGLPVSEQDLGERLYRLYADSPDTGCAGDMTLIDQWAEILGIREWYDWISQEDLESVATNHRL